MLTFVRSVEQMAWSTDTGQIFFYSKLFLDYTRSQFYAVLMVKFFLDLDAYYLSYSRKYILKIISIKKKLDHSLKTKSYGLQTMVNLASVYGIVAFWITF